MQKKAWRAILFFVLLIASGAAIWICEQKDWSIGEAIAGALTAIFIERLWLAIQDLLDTTNWKTSQRRLKRGRYVNDDTIIRISFAYLYRIKTGNKYLLIQNARNTGKYQPVGGVYKFTEKEKMYLKNHFQVKDDDKIPIDESSRNDYRLRMENRYLRAFMRRFNGKADRERMDNIGREFREELIDSGILKWKQIQYRFCGRHITELSFDEHFQVYELLLADIVELIPTKEQEQELQALMITPSEKYRFVTADEIKTLGIDTRAGDLIESIGDHSKKILEETEGSTIKAAGAGKVYEVRF